MPECGQRKGAVERQVRCAGGNRSGQPAPGTQKLARGGGWKGRHTGRGRGPLLALPSTSELLVFKPDGKQYTEVARYKVAETPTYAHPVISDNRVFVKDQESLAMWVIQ